MADRRRRKKSEGDSEEETDSTVKRDKHPSECESEGEHAAADNSEYESANEERGGGEEEEDDDDDDDDEESDEDESDDDDDDDDETYDGEDEDVILEGEDYDGFVDEERQSGDGEEQPNSGEKVDDDEDKKNPAYVPRKGAFYEHDMRISMDEVEEDDKKPKKKLWKDDGKWMHDKFRVDQQAPKSREELIAMYGYDIRLRDRPPESMQRSNKPRGRRSQQKPRLMDFVTDQNDEFVERKNFYNTFSGEDKNYYNENKRNYNSARKRFDSDDQGYGNTDREKREFSRTPDREDSYSQENQRGYRGTPDRDRGYHNRSSEEQNFQGKEERDVRGSYNQNYREDNRSNNYRDENRGKYREDTRSNYREDNRGYNREEAKQYSREDTRGNYRDNRRNNEDNRRGYEENRKSYDDIRRNYDDGRRNYDDGRRNYDDGRRNYDDSRRNYDDGRRNYDDGRRNYDDNRKGYDSNRRVYDDNRGYDRDRGRGFRDKGRGGNRGRGGRGERGRRSYNDTRENNRPERNFPPRFQRNRVENTYEGANYDNTELNNDSSSVGQTPYTESPISSKEQKQPFPAPPNVTEESAQVAPIAETVNKNELNIVVQNAGERKSYSKDRRVRTGGKTRTQETAASAVDHGMPMTVGGEGVNPDSAGKESTEQQKGEESSNLPANQQFDSKSYPKQDPSQQGKPKRYSSQRQRNLPDINYPEQVPMDGPAFFNSGQTTFRPPPPPQMLRPAISTVFPIPASSDTLSNQPRVFAPTRPPPPAAATVSLATQVPIIPQYNNTGVIYGAPPPPAPPTYQVPPGVPIQGFPSPPAGHGATVPLPPPPPQVASSQSQEVYRGGTTYYPPELQYKGSKRSPVRRPKAAIPIVNPQDVKGKRFQGDKTLSPDNLEETELMYQSSQDKDEMILVPETDVTGFHSDPASPSETVNYRDLEETSEPSSVQFCSSDFKDADSNNKVSELLDKGVEIKVEDNTSDCASETEQSSNIKETSNDSLPKDEPHISEVKKEVDTSKREECPTEVLSAADIKTESDMT